MFQYPQSLSWTEGIFLRPHHFQQSQHEQLAARASERELALPHAWGLLSCEFDPTALEHFSLNLSRLQGILPGGTPIDLPNNAAVEPLDLSAAVNSGATGITIYAGLLPAKVGEANLSTGSEQRRFIPTPSNCYDENAGGNEQPIMFRNLRLLLATQAESLPGHEKMPILRLLCQRSADGRPSLQVDRSFAPPALTLQGLPELRRSLEALLVHLDKISVNIITALRNRDMQTAEMAVARMERMGKNAIIQGSKTVLRQLLDTPATPPMAVYAELGRLAMQLAAYRPLEDTPAPALYNHPDCMPQFTAVVDSIYRLTATEATEWCVRVNLEYRDDLQAALGALAAEWLDSVRAVYVSVQSSMPPRRVADKVEEGDVFKLTAASQVNGRVRGVRLAEDRLPSPLLPTDGNRLWFRADHPERDYSWQDIVEEQQCALAWSPQILPGMQAELYLILSAPVDRR